ARNHPSCAYIRRRQGNPTMRALEREDCQGSLHEIRVRRPKGPHRAKQESGAPGPALAAHNDRDRRDRNRHVKESDRDGEYVMAVLVALAILELFFRLMFKRLAFRKKLFLLLPLALRFFLEPFCRWAAVRGSNGIKVFFEALCLIKTPIVGRLVL